MEWQNAPRSPTLRIGIGAMDDQDRQVWEGEDLEDLTKRLLLDAYLLLRRHSSWRGNAGSAPPGALSPDDLVQSAFEKYDRRTRPEGVTPYMLLKGIMRGDVGHLAAKKENSHDHVFFSSSDDGPGVIDPEALPDHNQQTPEEQLIARENADQVLISLRRRFSGDEDLLAYVDLRATELFESSYELSEALGVSREDIFNFQRRLTRFRRGEHPS
jgi:hypothetical protein